MKVLAGRASVPGSLKGRPGTAAPPTYNPVVL